MKYLVLHIAILYDPVHLSSYFLGCFHLLSVSICSIFVSSMQFSFFFFFVNYVSAKIFIYLAATYVLSLCDKFVNTFSLFLMLLSSSLTILDGGYQLWYIYHRPKLHCCVNRRQVLVKHASPLFGLNVITYLLKILLTHKTSCYTSSS